MRFVAREYISPPVPEPAATMPLAIPRRLLNHWFGMPTVVMKRQDMPKPKQIPWLRKSCQLAVTKEALTMDAVERMTPRTMKQRVGIHGERKVMSGAIRRAQEMLRPLTRA